MGDVRSITTRCVIFDGASSIQTAQQDTVKISAKNAWNLRRRWRGSVRKRRNAIDGTIKFEMMEGVEWWQGRRWDSRVYHWTFPEGLEVGGFGLVWYAIVITDE